MADPLAPLRRRFLERVAAPRPLGWLAVEAPRAAIALAVALVPAAVLLLLYALSPPAVGLGLIEPDRVRDAFGRFETATATVSTLAIGAAAVAFRHELRGVHKIRQHLKENVDYRDEVADGEGPAPLGVGALMSEALARVAEAARDARRVAGRKLQRTAGDARLGGFLWPTWPVRRPRSAEPRSC